MTRRRQLTIEDGPEILSSYLRILSDEARRILDIQPSDRKPQDIINAIKAATYLTSMNRQADMEVKQIRTEVGKTFDMLSPSTIRQIMNEKKS